MNTKIFYLFLFIILTSLSGCTSTAEPEEIIDRIPYMSLNVGDIREYYYSDGNSYITWEVVDKTIRTDNHEVFTIIESFQSAIGILYAVSYLFIWDDYLIRSELDSTDNVENPFNEERLAKLYPEDGDYFLGNKGAPDSTKIYMEVTLSDSISTHAGKFYRIAQYHQTESSNSSEMTIYYAEYYGHLGANIKNENGEGDVLLNYIKLNQEEIGAFVPLDTSLNRILINKNDFKMCAATNFIYIF